jgi:hypothetical protein
MVLEYKNIPMVLDIVVNGMMIKYKVEEKCINLVEIYMMENGKIINLTAKVFIFKQMEDNIMENGWMICDMDME